MNEAIAVPLSEEMQRLMTENPPPANLLPINAVFPELYYRDGQTGRVTVSFNISCDENEVMPSPMRMIIKTPHREIFHGSVLLFNYVSERFPGRKMMQADVTLSERDFAEIDNNPDTEVIFFCGHWKSTFLICI